MRLTATPRPKEFSAVLTDWKQTKFREICSQDRKIVVPSSAEARRLPYLGLEDVESQSGRILRLASDAVSGDGTSTTFAFDGRHVLYGKLRPYLNKVALPDQSGRCTTEIIPLLPSAGVDRNFLAWALRRNETTHAVMQEKIGGRMPRADMKILLDLEISLPPLAEQMRISAILTAQMAAVEKARAANDEQLAAAELLINAIVSDAFDGSIARKWPRKPLVDLSERISKGESPSWQGFDYVDSGPRFIRSENVRWGTFSDDPQTFVPKPFHQKLVRSALKGGDVLINLVGASIGRACVVPDSLGDANVNQAVAVVTPIENLRADFLVAFIISPQTQKYFKIVQVEMARPNISLDNLRQLQIPLPSPEEQRDFMKKISMQMSESRRLIAIIREQVATVGALPGMLLKKAFSGRL